MVSSNDLCYRSLLDNGTFIANTSFDHRKITIVAWNNIAEDIMEDFLWNYNGVVVIVHGNEEFCNLTAIHIEQYVLFVENSQDYNFFLQTLINREQVSPVRIIVILQTEDNINDIYNKILVNITLPSYKNDVTDILVLNCDDKNTVQIITYFPYVNQKQCNNTKPCPLKINNELEYFPRKFKNCHGCPIRSSAIDNPPFMELRKQNGDIVDVDGTEGKLVKLLAQILNATLKFTIASDQGVYGTLVNGRWTGSVGDLVYDRTDISAIAALINYGRFQVTQFIYPYNIQKIIWCAPQRREIQVWAKAVLPLFTDSTFLLGIASVLLLIVSNIARKVEFKKEDLPENNTLLWSWAIFLGQQVRFETKSWIINSLFAMWLGFCLILRIAYQGELSIFLQRQILEPPYTTLSEALVGVDAYGGLQSMLAFYSDHPDFLQKYNNLTLPQIHSWLDGISKGKRIMVSFEKSSLYELGYAHKIQTVEEASITAAVGVLVRKRWSAAEEISQLMMRITESGLYDKIVKDRQEKYRLIVAKNRVSKDNLQYSALGWYTLGACFYGLVIEWFVCLTVFLFENLWKKMKSKNNKT